MRHLLLLIIVVCGMGLAGCADQSAERLAYQQWYQGLSVQEQDREDRRRQTAAMGALMLMQGMPLYHAPAYQAPHPATTCTATAIGSSTYWRCP